MKRRDFLARASTAMFSLTLDGFHVNSLSKNSSLVQSLMQTRALNDDRILVIVYLGGGNDGLNTVIPLADYSKYSELRSNLAIPESKILRLAGNNESGLHPAMSAMRAMYDEGKFAIVHSVSYPNPNLSHFAATDIWMSGADAAQTVSSGWAGRYLGDRFVGYPQNYPNSQMEDPLAVQIGQISATALLGTNVPMATTLQDPGSFYQLIGESSGDPNGDLPPSST